MATNTIIHFLMSDDWSMSDDEVYSYSDDEEYAYSDDAGDYLHEQAKSTNSTSKASAVFDNYKGE